MLFWVILGITLLVKHFENQDIVLGFLSITSWTKSIIICLIVAIITLIIVLDYYVKWHYNLYFFLFLHL